MPVILNSGINHFKPYRQINLMLQIKLITENWVKNPNTKTTFLLDSVVEQMISEKEYQNITSKDTQKWFRRIGGTETATYNYTSFGYCVSQLVSTSPDKENKTVRKFTFKY